MNKEHVDEESLYFMFINLLIHKNNPVVMAS